MRQPSPSSTSTQQGAGFDISRVADIKNAFPPGFTVRTDLSKTLSQQDIDRAGIHILKQALLDPPQCLPAIIPPYADLTVGTKAAGVVANGDPGGIHVTALRLPEPVRGSQTPAGCDRIKVSSASVNGTAERVPAPHIEGATTTAVRLVENEKDNDYIFAGSDDHILQQDPDYLLTAALDGQTSIVIRGRVDRQLDPQQLFSDLLVKAAAAVRGR